VRELEALPGCARALVSSLMALGPASLPRASR
jgi:hypothetical protein